MCTAAPFMKGSSSWLDPDQVPERLTSAEIRLGESEVRSNSSLVKSLGLSCPGFIIDSRPAGMLGWN